MKKMITILALASALALVGCKKKAEDAAGSGSASASAGKVDDKGSGAASASGSGSASGSAVASGSGAAPTPGTGSPECDEYLKAFDDMASKCKDKLGPAFDAMKQSRDAQAASFGEWAKLDEASRKATVDAAGPGCKAGTDGLKQSAAAMGCTL